jgi:hypothetical protein
MAQTRVFAAIDAIVAALTAAGLKVWDGPIITDDYGDAIWVGYDGDPDGDFLSAETTQEWANLGATRRSETSSIICCAMATRGDEAARAARQAVSALVETAGSALRADPSLGQPQPFVAGLMPGNLYVVPTEQGVEARQVFSVRITIARV